MNPRQFSALLALLCSTLVGSGVTVRQANAATASELAKDLQNPIANLISVPVKLDWDTGIGPADANRSTYVVQPVIPFSLNDRWNVISRTITPFYIDAQSPVAGGRDAYGNGDILQSFFFSPKAPTARGWIWGAGPALSLPTASREALGTGQFSVGPTAVALKQAGGWTYGMLASHLWSVAGEGDRQGVSATFMQPFTSYTTKTQTSFGVNTESTYDWNNRQWTVPFNLSVSQLVMFGKQPVSFLVGYRYYAETPRGGPDWGIRAQVTFLLPK